MPWKLTVRTGSRVERFSFEEAGPALDALESRARELVRAAPKEPYDTRYKRYEPVQRVVARLELAGPERLLPSIRAGVDIRGDGSIEAHRGRLRRELLERAKGETPYDALRRSVQAKA